MAAVMIGVDPHKGSHTAVVIGPAEEPERRELFSRAVTWCFEPADQISACPQLPRAATPVTAFSS
jgi:hypothetical protein